jgi:hypothetical protein
MPWKNENWKHTECKPLGYRDITDKRRGKNNTPLNPLTVFLGKLMVAQLVINCPIFYRSQRHIRVSIRLS